MLFRGSLWARCSRSPGRPVNGVTWNGRSQRHVFQPGRFLGCAPSAGVSRFGGPSTSGRCRLLPFWPAKRVDFNGAPGPIRTADPLVRSRPSTINQSLTRSATFCNTSLFLSIHAVSPRRRVTLWHSVRTGRGYKSGHTVCGLEGLVAGAVLVDSCIFFAAIFLDSVAAGFGGSIG